MATMAEIQDGAQVQATSIHIVKFVVRDGEVDKFIEVLQPMFEQVKEEPGTLLYMMHRSLKEDHVIWFYERYADMEAFQIHQDSAVHKAVSEQMVPLLSPETELHFLDLVNSKALPSAG